MNKKDNIIKGVLFFMGVCLLYITYILFLNFKSLRVQKLVKEDLQFKPIRLTSSYLEKEFTHIPNLTSNAEPIAVQKARYLINEKKYNKAYNLLINDKTSLFDGRREYFLAILFYHQKKYDSVIRYAEQCRTIKPKYFRNLKVLSSAYRYKQEYDKALAVWKNYVENTPNEVRAWRRIIQLSRLKGDKQSVLKYTDTIKKLFPKNAISKRKEIGRNTVYREAKKHFKDGSYKQALALYSRFIVSNPKHIKSRESRAFCNYLLKNYKESNQDIDILEEIKGSLNPLLINLRGVNYYSLKDVDKACESFKRAKNMGDKDGISNYAKFCK